MAERDWIAAAWDLEEDASNEVEAALAVVVSSGMVVVVVVLRSSVFAVVVVSPAMEEVVVVGSLDIGRVEREIIARFEGEGYQIK